MYTELPKREQMDMIMAETRKRKTRRGKKSSNKRSTLEWAYQASPAEWCPDSLDLAKSYNKQSLRPVSPKAPLNSTQFLIEDRESLEMFETSPALTLDDAVFSKSNEQDWSIHSDLHVTDSNLSLYSDDSYYEPLWVTEDSEFMLKEFEKDYSAAFELETSFDYQMHIFDSLLKEEIVQKYMDLDRRFRKSDKKFNHSGSDKSSKSFKQTMAELLEENKRLLEENEKLKSSLLFGNRH